MSRLNDKGEEILDPTPLAIPVGFKRPESLAETIRRLVRNEEFNRAIAQRGAETFEEADDFEVGDDFDPQSPYETVFEPSLGKEVTRVESEFINTQRREFDRSHPPGQPKGKALEEEEPVKGSHKARKASGGASPKGEPQDAEEGAQ